MDTNELNNLNNFIIYGRGHYVMISGYDEKKDKYTFFASTPILKHILCDMNKSVILGDLSRCQMGGIFMALRNIGCGYDLVIINDKSVIVPKSKEKGFQRVQVKHN